MKYSKNAKYDYEINGINEENRYTKWYNKEITGKKLRLTSTYSQAFMWAVLFAASRFFADDIKAFGILETIGLLIINVIILLLVVAPMREILHLLPPSKGRLNKNCIISFKNHFSVYNDNVNRTQILISLALPLIVFVAAFGLSAVLTSGIVRYLAIFLLIESVYMCYADVYMFFFCVKNIGKNDTVFGEYKKS